MHILSMYTQWIHNQINKSIETNDYKDSVYTGYLDNELINNTHLEKIACQYRIELCYSFISCSTIIFLELKM